MTNLIYKFICYNIVNRRCKWSMSIIILLLRGVWHVDCRVGYGGMTFRCGMGVSGDGTIPHLQKRVGWLVPVSKVLKGLGEAKPS